MHGYGGGVHGCGGTGVHVCGGNSESVIAVCMGVVVVYMSVVVRPRV